MAWYDDGDLMLREPGEEGWSDGSSDPWMEEIESGSNCTSED